jgi:hypothetical protein
MLSSLRRLIVVLPALLLLAGCAKGPQDRLAGRWVGESIDNIPPDQEARANGWVKGASFEFRGDRVTIAVPAEDPRTGSYKVERVNGQKLTLSITRPSGEADEAVFTLTGENSMKWDLGNDRQVKLTRIVAQ